MPVEVPTVTEKPAVEEPGLPDHAPEHAYEEINEPLEPPPPPAESSFEASRDKFKPSLPLSLSIVVFGASGDLAKKKTYPALFALFEQSLLPEQLQIVGYARSDLSVDALKDKLRPYIKGDKAEEFLKTCNYCRGEYEPNNDSWDRLSEHLSSWEKKAGPPGTPWARLFYLALPPYVYPQVCKGLKQSCAEFGPGAAKQSWIRVIVEKPFGRDLESSEVLAAQLGELFPETQLYRIDHYLGKELSQNMLVMRFANPIFNTWWNRQYVSNVQVTFKEPFGTEGRGGYFDQYGIIRDVIQNHLLQMLVLMCMEPPVSPHPDDIRDEKLKVLRAIPVVKAEDCILGQYVGANGKPGYLDDPTVPKGSKTPTFAAMKLFVNNERWAGVPFIVKAGKALNERIAMIRIQLKPHPVSLFGVPLDHMRNEFVIRFQPGEALYAKMVVKKPGLDMESEMSELDMSYGDRYEDVHIPEAYERLILDCIRGDQQHFVRRDELRAAWAIFTPLLHQIDEGKIVPEKYAYGTRGPDTLEEFLKNAGYIKVERYKWPKKALANKL